jgi:hypothetical protein
LATTSAVDFPFKESRHIFSRDLLEIIFGFALIFGVIWMPEHLQRIFAPVALLATLAILLARRASRAELGLGSRGFLSSLWMIPAATALCVVSIALARQHGTLHPLSDGNLMHVGGYVLWTFYQQILLQDYFMPRLLRKVPSESASIHIAASLFALAHLPNLVLTVATLLWGEISCWLFLRYRNVYVLGLAQGMLGLCIAICVPDSLIHHMRVGLGFLHYHSAQPTP